MNKLRGSSQTAYWTFAGPFPHTSRSTFTRAGSCGAFKAVGTTELPVWGNKRLLDGTQRPPQTPVSPLLVCSFPTSTWRSRLDKRPVWTSVTHEVQTEPGAAQREHLHVPRGGVPTVTGRSVHSELREVAGIFLWNRMLAEGCGVA